MVTSDAGTAVTGRGDTPVVPSSVSSDLSDPAETSGVGATAYRPIQRRAVLLRLNPTVHDALARWATDDLRSLNAQIEYLLRAALESAGRLPGDVAPLPKRGRPPRQTD